MVYEPAGVPVGITYVTLAAPLATDSDVVGVPTTTAPFLTVNVTVPWLTVEPGAGLLAAATVADSVTLGSLKVPEAAEVLAVVLRGLTFSVLSPELPLKLPPGL